jgi:hypothetical protein
MIRVGRYSIVGFVVLATLLAIVIMDPNSKENFFLQIVDYQNYLTPGLLVAFFMGIFWKRGTGTAAIGTICAGVLFSWAAEYTYNETYGMPQAFYQIATEQVPLDEMTLGNLPAEFKDKTYAQIAAQAAVYKAQLNPINEALGHTLNFFHRVVFVLFFSVIVHVVLSLLTKADSEKGEFTFTGKGGASVTVLSSLVRLILLSIAFYAFCGILMVSGTLGIGTAPALGATWTLIVFQIHIHRHPRLTSPSDGTSPQPVDILRDDRFWASVLCSLAVFMHYFFY